MSQERPTTRRDVLTRAGVLCFVILSGIAISPDTPLSAESLRQHPVIRAFQPVSIVLPEFVAANIADAEPAHTITQIIAADLQQSGAFRPINQTVFLDKNVSIDEVPPFADWRAINAQGLVAGRITRQPDARIKVEFRLWDVSSGTQLTGWRYTGDPDDVRHIGHAISEAIYERVTGEKRSFFLNASP